MFCNNDSQILFFITIYYHFHVFILHLSSQRKKVEIRKGIAEERQRGSVRDTAELVKEAVGNQFRRKGEGGKRNEVEDKFRIR